MHNSGLQDKLITGGGVFWWLFLFCRGGKQGRICLFLGVFLVFACLFRKAHLSRLSTAFPDSVGRQHASTNCLKMWYILIFVHSRCNAGLRKDVETLHSFPRFNKVTFDAQCTIPSHFFFAWSLSSVCLLKQNYQEESFVSGRSRC